MISLTSLLRHDPKEKPFAGVIGLGGINVWKNMTNNFPASNSSMIQKTPLFLYNGRQDFWFDYPLVEFSYKYLKQHYMLPNGTVHKNLFTNQEDFLDSSVSQSEWRILN